MLTGLQDVRSDGCRTGGEMAMLVERAAYGKERVQSTSDWPCWQAGVSRSYTGPFKARSRRSLH